MIKKNQPTSHVFFQRPLALSFVKSVPQDAPNNPILWAGLSRIAWMDLDSVINHSLTAATSRKLNRLSRSRESNTSTYKLIYFVEKTAERVWLRGIGLLSMRCFDLLKWLLLKRMKYDFVRLIERVLVKVNDTPRYRVLTMSPIQMILWSAFFRTNFPKGVIFWNNWCDEIVGFVFPLCRKTFSIGIWLTSVWIMANAHSFCPWPYISEKKVRKAIDEQKCCITTKWAQII